MTTPRETVPKYTRFNQATAQRIMTAHLGARAYARRHNGQCEIGILEFVGCTRTLGTGPSYRKALEEAGVYFTST